MSWITSLFAGLFAGLGWIVVGAAVIAAILVHVFGKVLPSWVPAAVIAALGLAFVGNNVLKTEQLQEWPGSPKELSAYLCRQYGAIDGQIVACGKEEWFSPVASGSAAPKQMVVCPCSMGTVSAIANGTSDNLLERAADVVIKERGQLILVPRESPFSAIHLENMLKLARLGVTIMPAAPPKAGPIIKTVAITFRTSMPINLAAP